MIRSFADNVAESVFRQERSSGLPGDIQSRVLRKLQMLHAATELRDLHAPRGNRLEKLVGNREGQWSIRINDQWRVCFRWEAGDAYEVEMCDDH